MLQIIIIYLLPVLLFSFFTIKLLLPQSTDKNRPPSPPKLPIFGNLHQLGLYPHRSASSLAKRYGQIMSIQLGRFPAIFISSAEAAKEIMKTHDLIFSNRPRFTSSDRLLYDGKDVATAPYGEYWRQMRSICVLQLLSHKRVQSFKPVREEEIAVMVNKIEESSVMQVEVNLSELLESLTNDVICRVAFGRKYSGGKDGKKFKELLGEFMRLLGVFNIGGFVPWLAWVDYVSGHSAKVEKIAKEFDVFLDGIIEDHLDKQMRKERSGGSSEELKDLVDVLLDIQKDDNTTEFPIGRDNIKALILDMFAAGTDTTFTALEWTMTLILRHPRVLKEVQKEIRTAIGNTKQEITESHFDQTPYFRAVIKETLRLYPPIPLLLPRECTQDVKVMGYDIAAKTMVFTNAWAIGRDPAKWEKPEEFWPERFLKNTTDVKGQDFELIPFGAGRRGCPGVFFAMTTIEMVLANLLIKFDWELPSLSGEETEMIDECPGLSIHRKTPLLALATPFSS